MNPIGIIGGSGLYQLPLDRQTCVSTPYGEVKLSQGHWQKKEVFFLPRHGQDHHLAPHEINYRANIWALKQVGVHRIIAIASVGGITHPPGCLIVPDQIIDYTWGRAHSFNDQFNAVLHVDFTQPYCTELRQELLALDKTLIDGGTYGATQGPRLETAAEIARMERDGCDLVGMTGMPEAALARELDLCFAHLCLVVNWAAGKSEPIQISSIQHQLKQSMHQIIQLLKYYLAD